VLTVPSSRPKLPAPLVGCSGLLGRAARSPYTDLVTRTLDAAIAKLAALPPEEQDRVGRWLLDELADEEHWNRQFGASRRTLSKLAAEARADHADGKTTGLDFDKP
jgi:hypothetical protein